MTIIDEFDLASYPSLRGKAFPVDEVDLVLSLANGIVADVVGEDATVTSRMRAITLEVAARALRNPEGYSSETIDDYTYRRDVDTRQAGVYLTDAERAELTPGGSSRTGWLC